MKANIKHSYPGIYCIKNLVNDKKYIGKAKNIHKRIKQHITSLNTKSKDENPHLINAWHLYKRENFSYFVVEQLEFIPKLIAERELYWQDFYKCHDSNFGYNLRRDSSTGMICSEETKEKLRQANKQRIINFPNLAKEIGEKTSLFWKNNEDIKEQMSVKVSNKLTNFKILKLDYDMNILQCWDTQKQLKIENPELYLPAILQVCNGNKNSYLGFLWRYLDNETNQIVYQMHPEDRKLRFRTTNTTKVVVKSKFDDSIIGKFDSLSIACEKLSLTYAVEWLRIKKSKTKKINTKCTYYIEYVSNN